MKVSDYYAALPARLQDDLEARCLGEPYTGALYQYFVQTVGTFAIRNAPGAVVLKWLVPGSPDVNPLLVLVTTVEAVPLLLWPNLVRYCYAKANLVEAASLRLMLPDPQFVAGFQFLLALYAKTRRAGDTEPTEGVFAPGAADTVGAATEADLDFNC